jgi:hypothetical protein
VNLRCVTVAATLSARGEEGLTDSMRRHSLDCGRCRSDRADLAAYRDAVVSLTGTRYVAPASIVPRVMAEVGPWVVPPPAPAVAHRVRVGAAAIATAAATATAGTVVLMRMHRHRTA